MNESFLHYVWQMQYFQKEGLATTHGEPITVFKTGTPNKNAGPDFLQARIKIGNLEWNGHVEIHRKASDWQAHHHQHDEAYNNVVLHVVWDADQEMARADRTGLPCLELKSRVAPHLVHAYTQLVNSGAEIPCARSFPTVPPIYKTTMLERMVVERLEQKAEEILVILATHQHDWEQTAFQVLARNFGFKVNAEPFARLAQALPWKLIAKYRHNALRVEALIFGMAGFLETQMSDTYHEQLRREFQTLEALHQLSGQKLKASIWRFLRLRPANFPTVRLAQWSAWLSNQSTLYTSLVEATHARELFTLFRETAGDYWHHHYRFGKKARAFQPTLGFESIENIIINTVAPLQAAAGKWYGQHELIERACALLQQLPAEKNQVTRLWTTLGWPANSAFQSQGNIQLYRHYCEKRRCLSCAIGNQVLKPGQA